MVSIELSQESIKPGAVVYLVAQARTTNRRNQLRKLGESKLAVYRIVVSDICIGMNPDAQDFEHSLLKRVDGWCDALEPGVCEQTVFFHEALAEHCFGTYEAAKEFMDGHETLKGAV